MPKSIESLWLTFPDPYPKKRSATRRMTHPNFLETYKKVLKTKGAIYIKHDDTDFFKWSLEQLVSNKWDITEVSFDLHESDLPEDYKTHTTYELRWLNENKATNFVRANKRDN